MCQNLLVPALDAGPQKDRPYQSDFYRAGSNAIPRGARGQGDFDTPPFSCSNNIGFIAKITVILSYFVFNLLKINGYME